MLFNSINCTLKNVFYSLEKILSGNRTSPLEESEHARLNAINHKGIEASTASGQFLDRARRGETLKSDQETHEIVKDYVRTKNTLHIEDAAIDDQTTDVSAASSEALARSISDETPIFGLKASLHASTNSGSFDAWKSAHHVLRDDVCESLAIITADTVSAYAQLSLGWRDLSRHTALRLIDHPNTPSDVLMQLAQHIDAEVRAQVADNLNTPQDAILLLLKDESTDVRYALAESYHLGKAHLEILLEDDNPYVVARAEETLQRLSAAQNPTPVTVIGNMFGLLEGRQNLKDQAVTPLRARA